VNTVKRMAMELLDTEHFSDGFENYFCSELQ